MNKLICFYSTQIKLLLTEKITTTYCKKYFLKNKMLHMHTLLSKLISLQSFIILGICFLGCKKDSQQTAIVISAITPAFGPYSTIDTITGSGFNSNAADNNVKFNGMTAVVQKASATQLIVVVPKAAGTGAVTVQSGTVSGSGPVFTYIYTGTVITVAGSGTAGFADGNGAAAQFSGPYGVTTDAQGNIYVADYGNVRIRKITSAGIVSTVAGNGTTGYVDGSSSAAEFNSPAAVSTDAQSNIYVADDLNNRIRKINSSGIVNTFAGSGVGGFADGIGNAAQFNDPVGLATDAQGNIYVSDFLNNSIRKITPDSVVSTFAGSAALFNGPIGLTTDAQGNIYVADILNNRICKITSAGVTSTLAGGSVQGYADGIGSAAQFNLPTGVAADAQGNIYVVDGNNRIREITPAGVVGTVAGSATPGLTDGVGSAAQFNGVEAIAIDAHGNIYVADGNRIRMITVQ
jgi:sugar lactone lactonase YvrE